VSRKLTTRMMKSKLHFEMHDKKPSPFRSFGYRFKSFIIPGVGELESRKQLTAGTRDMRNHKKIWTVESSRLWTVDLTPFQSFGYRELEESRVETLHHRSPEVAKCETPKSRNRHINKDSISEFRRPGNQRSKEL
jgi:hypothetical protein